MYMRIKTFYLLYQLSYYFDRDKLAIIKRPVLFIITRNRVYYYDCSKIKTLSVYTFTIRLAIVCRFRMRSGDIILCLDTLL